MDQTPQSLDLTPEIVNLEAPQGTDVSIEIQLTNGSAAVNITNDTGKITVKDAFGGTVKIPTISIPPGSHSDPTNGKTTFKWTKLQTTTTTPTDEITWKWEARRVFSSGDEVVYIHGDLKLMPSVGL